MRVLIGSDHAGLDLKNVVSSHLKELGHEVFDIGTNDTTPVDYPDIAEAAALHLVEKRSERGVLICGSGVGVSVAANKIPGIRAGLCHDIYSAHQSVEHDDVNVLVLGSRVVGSELAKELVSGFLAARFTGEERHRSRLNKIAALERRYAPRCESMENSK